MEEKDLDLLKELLSQAAENTRIVRRATNMKIKLEEEEMLLDELESSTERCLIPNTKQLLNQANRNRDKHHSEGPLLVWDCRVVLETLRETSSKGHWW